MSPCVCYQRLRRSEGHPALQLRFPSRFGEMQIRLHRRIEQLMQNRLSPEHRHLSLAVGNSIEVLQIKNFSLHDTVGGRATLLWIPELQVVSEKMQRKLHRRNETLMQNLHCKLLVAKMSTPF